MPNELEYVDFTSHSLDICDVNDFVLLQDLDCDFLPTGDVYAQLDFAESALAQGFILVNQHVTNDVVAYTFLGPGLVVGLLRRHHAQYNDDYIPLYRYKWMLGLLNRHPRKQIISIQN